MVHGARTGCILDPIFPPPSVCLCPKSNGVLEEKLLREPNFKCIRKSCGKGTFSKGLKDLAHSISDLATGEKSMGNLNYE